MADSAEMQELVRLLREMMTGFSGASRGAHEFGDSLGDLADIQGDLKRTYRDLANAQRTQTGDIAGLNRKINDLWQNYNSAAQASQRYKVELDAHNKAIRHSINAQKNYCDRLRDTGEHYGKLIGLGVNLGLSFGAQSIGLRKLVGSVKEYNENLFKIQRTQQVFGRGMGDLNKALSTASKQTTLSRIQFLQFSNTMMDGYKGIKPSMTALADFASVIQKQFNPSMEETIRVGKEFLDIYDKFPAAAEAIKSAMELATKGNLNAQEKRSLNNSKAMIASLRIQGKISESVYATFVKGMSKTTKEQNATIDFNRKINKSSAQVEDAMLEVGKKSEGALKLAADATTVLYMGLEKVAGAAAIATASISALNLQASAMSTISAMNLVGGTGVRGGAGAALTAATASALGGRGLRSGARPLIGRGSATTVPSINSVAAGSASGASRFLGARSMMRGAGTIGLISGAMSGYGAYTKARAEEDPRAMKKGLLRGAISAAGSIGGAVLGGAITGGNPLGAMAGGALGGMGADKLGEMLENKIWPKSKEVADVNGEINDELSKQVQEYQKQITNSKYILETTEQLSESTKMRLDMMVQLNQSLRDQDGLLKKQVEDYEGQSKAADKVLDNISSIAGAIMKANEVEWVPDSSLDQIQNAQKAVEAINSQVKDIDIKMDGIDPKNEKEMNSLIANRTALLANQKLIQDAINSKNKASIGYVKSSVDVVSASAKQEEEMNSVYSERLATQRQLMETAQFGFGASVAMLQQQVDLEYELMNVQKERMSKFRQSVIQQHRLTEEQTLQLEGARSYNEAQNMITKSFGKTGDAAKALVSLSQDFQKSQSETMKHQQKIYELTKEMREGYMDAFREMSANVGEFSKIIGTQETGMTQLMKTVEDVTGEKKLNTMKGGVMVSAGYGGYDARRGVAGRYTIGGAKFRGQGEWESLNQDIYGYGKETQDKPIVGGAVSDFMKDGGAGAFRDALEKTPAGDQATMATAVRDGVVAARNNLFINPATASGKALGAVGPTNVSAHGEKLVGFSRGVAAAAETAEPARNVQTPVGNIFIKQVAQLQNYQRRLQANILQIERSWRKSVPTRFSASRETAPHETSQSSSGERRVVRSKTKGYEGLSREEQVREYQASTRLASKRRMAQIQYQRAAAAKNNLTKEGAIAAAQTRMVKSEPSYEEKEAIELRENVNRAEAEVNEKRKIAEGLKAQETLQYQKAQNAVVQYSKPLQRVAKQEKRSRLGKSWLGKWARGTAGAIQGGAEDISGSIAGTAKYLFGSESGNKKFTDLIPRSVTFKRSQEWIGEEVEPQDMGEVQKYKIAREKTLESEAAVSESMKKLNEIKSTSEAMVRFRSQQRKFREQQNLNRPPEQVLKNTSKEESDARLNAENFIKQQVASNKPISSGMERAATTFGFGAGDSGGMVKVVVALGSGLEGTIEKTGDVMVQLEKAASRTSYT